jgi:hypothetical protein
MMAIVSTLRAAKKLIKTYGWTQGALHRDGKGYCMTGAIVATTGDEATRDEAIACLRHVCGCTLLVNWNDATNRQRRDIDKAFDSAIRFAANSQGREG